MLPRYFSPLLGKKVEKKEKSLKTLLKPKSTGHLDSLEDNNSYETLDESLRPETYMTLDPNDDD